MENCVVAFNKNGFDTNQDPTLRIRNSLFYNPAGNELRGVVSDILRQNGNFVADPLFVLCDARPLIAFAHLPEQDALDLRPGQPVQMEMSSKEGTTFEGGIRRISPIVDPKTGETEDHRVRTLADNGTHAGVIAREFVAEQQRHEAYDPAKHKVVGVKEIG